MSVSTVNSKSRCKSYHFAVRKGLSRQIAVNEEIRMEMCGPLSGMGAWGDERVSISSGSILPSYVGEEKVPEEWKEMSQVLYSVTLAVQKSLVESNLEGPH